jgi:hypothetical protein
MSRAIRNGPDESMRDKNPGASVSAPGNDASGDQFETDERTNSIYVSHWIYRGVFHGVKTLISLDAEPSSS